MALDIQVSERRTTHTITRGRTIRVTVDNRTAETLVELVGGQFVSIAITKHGKIIVERSPEVAP
jgi:hypothetical protein